MSSKSITARAGPVTNRQAFTEQETVQWLKTDARVPANAIEIDKRIYGLVSRLLPRGPQQIWQLLIGHWAPRFESPVSDDTASLILELVTAAHAAILKADDDEKHRKAAKELADLQRRIAERARARAAERELSNAEIVKAIAAELKCTKAYVYTLLDPEQGTTDGETAAIVGKITGEPASKYLRQAKRRGRRVWVTEVLNKYHVHGCTIWDFAQSDPKLDGKAGELAGALKAGYADARIVDHHYKSSDDFRRRVARLLGFDTDTAEAFWLNYLRWRVDAIREVLIFELDIECFG